MDKNHISDPATKLFRRNTLLIMDEILDRMENGLGYMASDDLWDRALELRNRMASEFSMPGVTREQERTNNFKQHARDAI